MASPQTVKPLVDRLLSNPLHFKLADPKSDSQGGNKEENFIGMGAQKPSYIVIGKRDEPVREPIKDSSTAEEASQSLSKRRKVLPKSLEEALNMYTTGPAESAGSSSTNPVGSASTSDSEGNRNTTGPSDPSETEEVFHEAREYAVDGEDVGEDVGVSEGTNSGASTSEDEDFEDPEDNSDSSSSSSSNGRDQQDEAEGSVSDISENEKLQLQQEALEASRQERKETAVQQQETQENGTQPDDGSQFFQFNEEINDAGSIKDRRIVKNWGPALTNLKPRGLLNHGVTCYTNAAVQAMVHIPAVQHYLFDILRGKYADTISEESVSYVLAEITRKMWLPQEKFKKKRQPPQYINPRKLLSRLDDINCMMSEWQQEDSHEYFMSLMSRLQEDSVPRGHKLTESIMYDIFGGVLEQVVTCKSCGSVSKTEQPFYDLSLHLRAKRKQSMDSPTESDASGSALDSKSNSQQDAQSQQSPRRFSIEKSISDFFNPELIKVDKEQKGYVCERCHMTTNAIKHNSILRAPETLLVHLKKFRFNGTSSSKMKQAVSYPMFLDLTKYCVEGKELPLNYQLITVVVHEGRSLSSGHYIVHCKQPEGHWATYDDEYINNISEKEALREPNAYYLIYTRLTPRQAPLRSSSLVTQDLEIPEQISSQGTPVSSPNTRGKKWKKNKKRRFNH